MTINPAAGPLIVISELLRNVVKRAPMMAVKTPPSDGNPLASEILQFGSSMAWMAPTLQLVG